jgi:hypothetical protein
VRSLLGRSALGLAGRIRADAAPLGDLAAEEFVMFVSYLSSGLALPISPFFLLLLEEFGLQLQHLKRPSLSTSPGCSWGVAPCTSLFCHFFVLVKSGKARDHLGAYYFQTRPDSTIDYISTFGGARWENWRGDWVIVVPRPTTTSCCRATDQPSTASTGRPSRPWCRSSCPY